MFSHPLVLFKGSNHAWLKHSKKEFTELAESEHKTTREGPKGLLKEKMYLEGRKKHDSFNNYPN